MKKSRSPIGHLKRRLDGARHYRRKDQLKLESEVSFEK